MVIPGNEMGQAYLKNNQRYNTLIMKHHFPPELPVSMKISRF